MAVPVAPIPWCFLLADQLRNPHVIPYCPIPILMCVSTFRAHVIDSSPSLISNPHAQSLRFFNFEQISRAWTPRDAHHRTCASYCSRLALNAPRCSVLVLSFSVLWQQRLPRRFGRTLAAAAAARRAASAEASAVERQRPLRIPGRVVRAPKPPDARPGRSVRLTIPPRAGNVFPTPGEETGFFFMLPKKKNSAAPQEKAATKKGKRRGASKGLKLGFPALKLAIIQNPIKGFFRAVFNFSPAEGSVTYAEPIPKMKSL